MYHNSHDICRTNNKGKKLDPCKEKMRSRSYNKLVFQESPSSPSSSSEIIKYVLPRERLEATQL